MGSNIRLTTNMPQNIGDFLLTHFLAVADVEDEPSG